MDYDYPLLAKPHVSVYQCPPMASAEGHMMGSWKTKLENCSVKIMAKGLKCEVVLNGPTGELFARSPIPEKFEQAVLKCVDSTRAFALKVLNPNGGSAWIGLVFRERNDAFDFNVCFEDFAKNRDMELNPEKYANENKPTKDFSLKPGEKINFNIGSESGGSSKPKSSGGSFEGFGLAPPPGMGGAKSLPFPTSQPKPSVVTAAPKQDLTDIFGFSGNTNTSQPPKNMIGGGFGSQPQPQSNNNDPFAGFGGFGNWSTQPTSNNSAPPTQSQDPFAGFGGFGAPTNTSNQSQQQSSNKPSTQQVNLLDLQF
jgi:hypothetical protein